MCNLYDYNAFFSSYLSFIFVHLIYTSPPYERGLKFFHRIFVRRKIRRLVMRLRMVDSLCNISFEGSRKNDTGPKKTEKQVVVGTVRYDRCVRGRLDGRLCRLARFKTIVAEPKYL